MKDLKFLLFSSLVIITLIGTNLPIFIKSLGSNKFASPKLKEAAQQVKIEDFRKTEQEFWDSIKEVDFEDTSNNSQGAEPKPSASSTPEESGSSSKTDQKKQEKPYKRFLLVGDSTMYAYGVAFNNKITKSNYDFDKIQVEFKISTGLNRIDFYDWYSRTSQLISKHNPDVMVVIFGGNDDQDIKDKNGIYRSELTPQWKKAYQERVERYVKLLDKSSVRKVYWIGHPISNTARYNKFFRIFNEIYKNAAKTYSQKVTFVDSWNVFAVNGKFSPVIADKSGKKAQVRTSDGVHFTQHGANILVEHLREKMIQDKVLQPKKKVLAMGEYLYNYIAKGLYSRNFCSAHGGYNKEHEHKQELYTTIKNLLTQRCDRRTD